MPRGLVRLTADDLKQIRAELEAPYYGINSALARRYGVSEKTIRNIRNGTYTI